MIRALSDPTVAVALYVVSHHSGAGAVPTLPWFVEQAHAHAVPVLVDAAAEVDMRIYVEAGADLVVYSGHKAVRGPTSGILVGRADLVHAAGLHQNLGIGRAMKVGKEQMAGLAVAVERYLRRDIAAERAAWVRTVERLEERLGARYRTARTGEPHRGVVRLALLGSSDWAQALVEALEGGTPSIRTRNHEVGEGRVILDPRFLGPATTEELCDRLIGLVSTGALGRPGSADYDGGSR